jgi:hypothetical protein
MMPPGNTVAPVVTEVLMSKLSLQMAILVGALVALIAARPAAQTLGSPERFTALAVNVTGGGTAPIEIAVNRWSTNAERSRLLTTLAEKGPDKLLDVLRDMPKVGFIRQTSSIGWDLRYARRTDLPDGGERVVIATDRPISTWEAANQPRTIDYPFTVIELRLDSSGQGEGKMSYATKITADKRTDSIVLENWGTSPVLLQGVHRERSK